MQEEHTDDIGQESNSCFISDLPITGLLFKLYDPAKVRSIENKVDKYIESQNGLYRLGLNIGYLTVGTIVGLLYIIMTLMIIPMMGMTVCLDMIVMGVISKGEENGISNKSDTR